MFVSLFTELVGLVSGSVLLLYAFVNIANEIVVRHNTSDIVFDEKLLEDWLERIFV